MRTFPALLLLAFAITGDLCAATVAERIAAAGLAQVGVTTQYDPSYVKLAYPNGDVPAHTGVCADVVVRALRKVNVDLQEEVHKDMTSRFSEYPKNWGLRRPDKNIDHRRVPNLMKFFERKGKSLSINDPQQTYLPGDIVAWKLQNGLYHIGIVSAEKAAGGNHYLMIHNIGSGAQKEDVLKAFKILGHYRWN